MNNPSQAMSFPRAYFFEALLQRFRKRSTAEDRLPASAGGMQAHEGIAEQSGKLPDQIQFPLQLKDYELSVAPGMFILTDRHGREIHFEMKGWVTIRFGSSTITL